MKKILSWVNILALLAVSLSFAGCETMQGVKGATVGGIIGGAAGALLDKKNRWRGGVIGAAAGALIGGGLAEISAKAKQRAADTGETVVFETEDKSKVFRAEPVNYSARRRCNRIKSRVWENGKQVEEKIEKVCRS